MISEKLTDEDLKSLRRCMPKDSAVGKLVAEFDAQAAVIARVRAALEAPNKTRRWKVDAAWEALAAAPEHTAQALDVVPKGWRRTAAGGLCYDPEAAPEQTAPTMADLNCERDLRQARARVAELEADRKELSAVLGRTEESLVAANARADAAELAHEYQRKLTVKATSDTNDALTAVASLKLQLEACRGVAESEAATQRAERDAANARVAKAILLIETSFGGPSLNRLLEVLRG